MLIILQIVTYIRDLEIETHIYYAFRNSMDRLPIGNLDSPSAKPLVVWPPKHEARSAFRAQVLAKVRAIINNIPSRF